MRRALPHEHNDEKTFESYLAFTARFKGPRVISRRKAAASVAAAVGGALRMKPNRGTPTTIPSTFLPTCLPSRLLTSLQRKLCVVGREEEEEEEEEEETDELIVVGLKRTGFKIHFYK